MATTSTTCSYCGHECKADITCSRCKKAVCGDRCSAGHYWHSHATMDVIWMSVATIAVVAAIVVAVR